MAWLKASKAALASAGTHARPHAVTGPRLAALAEGRAWVPPWCDPDVAAALHGELLGPGRDPALGAVVAVRVLPDDGLTVLLEVDGDPDLATAGDLAAAAVRVLGGVPILGERCPSGISVGVAPR